MRMLLMPSPAAVSCPPTQQKLWTLPNSTLNKKRQITDDEVIITKEAQRFIRIYIFFKKSIINTPINFLNNFKVKTFWIWLSLQELHKVCNKCTPKKGRLKPKLFIPVYALYENQHQATIKETLASSMRDLANTNDKLKYHNIHFSNKITKNCESVVKETVL